MAKVACSLYLFLQDSWIRVDRILVNPPNHSLTIWSVSRRDQLQEEFPVFFEAQGIVYSYLCHLESMTYEKECYRYRCHIVGTWTN